MTTPVIRKWRDGPHGHSASSSFTPYDMALHDERRPLPRTERQSMKPAWNGMDALGRLPMRFEDWSEIEEFDDLAAPMRPTRRVVLNEWDAEPWELYDQEKVDAPCWCHCPGSWKEADRDLVEGSTVLCPECERFLRVAADGRPDYDPRAQRFVPPHAPLGKDFKRPRGDASVMLAPPPRNASTRRRLEHEVKTIKKRAAAKRAGRTGRTRPFTRREIAATRNWETWY